MDAPSPVNTPQLPQKCERKENTIYNRSPTVLSQSQQDQCDKGLIFNVFNTWGVWTKNSALTASVCKGEFWRLLHATERFPAEDHPAVMYWFVQGSQTLGILLYLNRKSGQFVRHYLWGLKDTSRTGSVKRWIHSRKQQTRFFSPCPEVVQNSTVKLKSFGTCGLPEHF